MSKSPITIKDVAGRAGLSYQTVSKVLNNSGQKRHLYRSETQAKVFAAAQELGYLPNSFAQAMRSGRFGTIALLLSTHEHRSTLSSALLDGIHDAMLERDLHLIVTRLPDEQLTNEGFVPRVLREWASDGLLINYTDRIPPKMVELIDKHALPSIWLNTKLAHDCVHPDDLGAAVTATETLLNAGHRRIAYVQSIDWDAHYSTVDRTAGYERAMRQAGLQPIVWGNLHERHLSDHELLEFGRTLSTRLAQRIAADEVTAIVAYSPTDAAAAARAAGMRGLSVPEQFAVIPFAEAVRVEAGWVFPTMVVPGRAMGRVAVDMLLKKIESPRELLPTRAVPFGPPSVV